MAAVGGGGDPVDVGSHAPVAGDRKHHWWKRFTGNLPAHEVDDPAGGPLGAPTDGGDMHRPIELNRQKGCKSSNPMAVMNRGEYGQDF